MANKLNHNVEQLTVVTVNSMCLTKKTAAQTSIIYSTSDSNINGIGHSANHAKLTVIIQL